jgi:ribulose kinase
MELYADATGCTVQTPREEDAVLLGSAMVAAAAAGLHPDLPGAAAAMTAPGSTITPDPGRAEGYRRDYQVFLAMHDQRRALDRIAGDAAG